jgi:hypothetical protein
VYIPHVKNVSEKFKRIGNRYNIKTSSKQNTNSKVHSWKLGRKEIRNRRHSASLCMWQKLHWRNRQTSSREASWTQTQSQKGYSGKIKISPTCLWRGS